MISTATPILLPCLAGYLATRLNLRVHPALVRLPNTKLLGLNRPQRLQLTMIEVVVAIAT
jgi:hypothetical protein